jgi:hypothetical protein
MVEADLRALNLTGPNGDPAQGVEDNAYIRQNMGQMVD